MLYRHLTQENASLKEIITSNSDHYARQKRKWLSMIEELAQSELETEKKCSRLREQVWDCQDEMAICSYKSQVAAVSKVCTPKKGNDTL